jgi:hypothetical protein
MMITLVLSGMAAPGGLEHEQLFKDVTEMVREYLLKYGQRSSKVHYFVLYIRRIGSNTGQWVRHKYTC